MRSGSAPASRSYAAETARNVISGNGEAGVRIARGVGNLVVGNFIGTASDGLSPLPNARGVHLLGGASGNRIGQAGENLAKLIALHGDAADADLGRRADHLQLFTAASELGQALLSSPPDRRWWLAGTIKRDEWNGGNAAEMHLEDAALA